MGAMLTLLLVTLLQKGGALAVTTLGSVVKQATRRVVSVTDDEAKLKALLDKSLTQAKDASQKQVLTYLRSRGLDAVQDFATQSGLTPAELLARVTNTEKEQKQF